MGDINEGCVLLAKHSDSDTDEGNKGFPENPIPPKRTEHQEWKLIKSGNDLYKKLFCEFVNGRKTERRMCIKCSKIVKSFNYGTSSMLGHLKICAGQTGSNSWQNRINVTVCEPSTGPMKKGFNEVAALVYENQLSVNAVATSRILRNSY